MSTPDPVVTSPPCRKTRRPGRKPGRPAKAVAREPLPEDRRALALTARRVVYAEVWRASRHLLEYPGFDALVQEAWVAVCAVAADWAPGRGEFGAWARRAVRRRMWYLALKLNRRRPVWWDMGATEDALTGGVSTADEALVDHRDPFPAGRLVHLWNDPDLRRQRLVLTWRQRVVLHLRCVLGYSLEEVGGLLGGASRQYALQIQEAAAYRLRLARGEGRRAPAAVE